MISRTEATICEQHAANASFLWMLRDAAARDAGYDLASLGALDARVEAHLDGLRLAGSAGWDICEAALGDAESGEVFAAAFVAIDRRDLPGVAHVLDIAGAAPTLRRGLIAALGWAPRAQVDWLVPGLLDARCPPELHYLGIAACAAHRKDPGAALRSALSSEAPRLAARALRAAGELGRVDLLPEIRPALRSDDAARRFWAAWSAALFGEPQAAEVLFRFAGAPGPFAARACSTAMRRLDPPTAHEWLRLLADTSPKAALAGAAALGDPALMPWILDAMKAPELARLAGAAFTMITGTDLVAGKLSGRPPKGAPSGPTDDPADEDVALDPEEGLPWPDPGRVAALWGTRRKDLPHGTRYLLGKAMTSPEWLGRVLREGSQPARAAAAEELSIRHPHRPLFEVRAPGPRQRAELGL